MKFLFLFFSLVVHFNVEASSAKKVVSTTSATSLNLSRADNILAEKIINMVNLAEKGYINQEVLNKVIKDASSSKNFTLFLPWLNDIKKLSQIKKASDFFTICNSYNEPKALPTIENLLQNIASNYCRERVLEAIGREIDQTKKLSDENLEFIKQNLNHYLSKENRKNFSFFLQSQNGKPAVQERLSKEVTLYSVQNDFIPNSEILQDIVINDQMTSLIQDKGFATLHGSNVFYAEYGKLIEQAYRSVDGKNADKAIKENFNFLKNYYDLNQDHLPRGMSLTRMNDFAKSVYRNGYKEISRTIFRYIIKKNAPEVQEDALFSYLWTYIYSNDYSDTLKMAKKYDLLKNFKSLSDPRLKYWLAHASEEDGKKSESIEYYENIISNHPLSFYSIMSTKRLTALKPDSPLTTFYTNTVVNSSSGKDLKIEELDADFQSSLIRLKAWAKIDSSRFLNLELQRLNSHSLPGYLVKKPAEAHKKITSDFHLLNGRVIQDADNYLASFRYLYQYLDRKEVEFNKDLVEILYPRPYLDVLSKEIKKHKLDSIVVLSLIRQESVFNPQARSSVGARGLMQLMPATARFVKKSVHEKHLSNPQINIEIGTKYFQGLMKKYDSNLVYVLSAYNAGEGRVERWKSLYFETDKGIEKNIETIPFLETRNYVKLIFRNIFFYKILTNTNPDLADPIDPNRIFDVNLGYK